GSVGAERRPDAVEYRASLRFPDQIGMGTRAAEALVVRSHHGEAILQPAINVGRITRFMACPGWGATVCNSQRSVRPCDEGPAATRGLTCWQIQGAADRNDSRMPPCVRGRVKDPLRGAGAGDLRLRRHRFLAEHDARPAWKRLGPAIERRQVLITRLG